MKLIKKMFIYYFIVENNKIIKIIYNKVWIYIGKKRERTLCI